MSSYCASAVSGNDAHKHEHETLRGQSPFILFPKYHIYDALPGRAMSNPSKNFHCRPTLLSWPMTSSPQLTKLP